MKCNKCGKDSPDDRLYCEYCGNRLVAPAVTQDVVHNRFCVGCGRAMSWDAKACQYCGQDYGAKPPETKSNDDALVIGGILSILAGIVSILLVTIIMMDYDYADISDAQLVFMSMLYIFAVIAVIGGLSNLSRSSFTVSVLGAACGIIGLGFFFAIPALVLTAKTSDEFEKEE